MGERGALCILLMICIIGGAFLLGGLLFSRSVSTILQLVVAGSLALVCFCCCDQERTSFHINFVPKGFCQDVVAFVLKNILYNNFLL